MKLHQPYKLGALAALARERVRARLSELGSPDLPFEVNLSGDDQTVIEAVSPVENIEPRSLTFATNKNFLALAERSPAAAVVLPYDLSSDIKPYLQTAAPRLVFSIVLELAMEDMSLTPAAGGGVRFKDRSRVTLGDDVILGDWCYIGRDVDIGPGSRIYPHVFIDDDVVLGENCVVYPGATIFRNTRLGRKVIIHAGAVIGDDGFGYNQIPDAGRGRLHHLKNEHTGGVVIEDFVEVGSQVCIDRGLAGMTVVGAGTKIDNLTQIGHNVRIGRDCIVVKSAMAGSSRLGNRVFLMGSKVKDGVTVGDDAAVLFNSGVMSDIPPGPVRWAGHPVQPAEQEWKITALSRRELPRLRRFFQLFKKASSFEELRLNFFEDDRKGGE